MDELFPEGLEPLLATLAERLMGEGAELEVELLTAARASLLHARTDPALGDQYCLCLTVPPALFERAARTQDAVEARLLGGARRLLPRPMRAKLHQVALAAALVKRRDWRRRGQEWIEGPVRKGRLLARPPAEREAPRVWARVTVEVGRSLEEARAEERGEQRRTAPKEPEPPAKERYKWTRIA